MIFDELSDIVLHDVLVAGKQLFLSNGWVRVPDMADQVLVRCSVVLCRAWTRKEQSVATRCHIEIVIARDSKAERRNMVTSTRRDI